MESKGSLPSSQEKHTRKGDNLSKQFIFYVHALTYFYINVHKAFNRFIGYLFKLFNMHVLIMPDTYSGSVIVSVGCMRLYSLPKE
jgi:hypothetical protein